MAVAAVLGRPSTAGGAEGGAPAPRSPMSLSLAPQLAALFVIVFARVGTMLMLLPTLGEALFPARVRLGLSVMLTLVFIPIVQPLVPAGQPITSALGLLLFEIAVGLTIGLAGRLVVASLQIAGNFVAQALGLAFAESVDPTQGGQSAQVGNFLTLTGIAMLFATDAHHLVIGAIHGSYTALPPGMLPDTGDAAKLAITTMAKGFAIAVQIAAPFIVFALVFNLGLGVLARLMPSLQVFFLGMPATILFGFLVLAASIALMMTVFLKEVSDFLRPLAGG